MNGRTSECPFCALALGRVERESPLAVAFFDAYPVSEGHALVIPRRHVASAGDLTEAEVAAIWQLMQQMREEVTRRHHPEGFNIGVNDGAAAGQTVGHAHFHLIPRYLGDRPDPRGGVRWLLPDRAKYWE